jgi:uncharacterized RDD family membrane protein YckC
MDWYYAESGRQAGPVNDAQFAELVASGKITPDTLVWHQGMAQWQPYRAVSPASTITTEPSPAGPLSEAMPASQFICSECGQAFPESEVTHYGTVWVCGRCKPTFVQKLSAGVPEVPGGVRYAGFGIRFAAKFLDGLITSVVTGPLTLLMALISPAEKPEVIIALQVLFSLVSVVISAAYYIFFVGRYGATPGKMICRLKIITADGGTVSYARATGRFFAEMLSGCPTLMIGYLLVAFDDERRALHDHICGTRVIYKS